MSREVRKVPADWQHPTDGFYNDGKPRYIGVFKCSFDEAAAIWDEAKESWDCGERPEYTSLSEYPIGYPFEKWDGKRPIPEHHMPSWSEEEKTHYMMYETCSEGTPISPAFSTPEELARWLVDNNASAFADQTASYKAWLNIAYGGFAPSAVMIGGQLLSGVEAMSKKES